MKIAVAVIFGGKSVEHEISVLSACQVIENLDTSKYQIIPVYITKENLMFTGPELLKVDNFKDINQLLAKSHRVEFRLDAGRTYLTSRKSKQLIDIAFPVVHGTNVEDGALAGVLKSVNLPFVGCDVASAALCMDKFFMKNVLQEAGLPVLEAALFTEADFKTDRDIAGEIEQRFGYPVIAKPANLGSSIGIKIARNRFELDDALENAFSFARRVLVERAVENLKEVNCSVLGDCNSARASVCEEPLGAGEILSYADKYLGSSQSKGQAKSSSGGSKGMASLGRKIPADIAGDLEYGIRELALKTFKTLDCSGVARIDFIVDLNTGAVFVNEINSIPGSLAFYLWEASGLKFPALLDELIALGFARMRAESEITYSFDTNILSATRPKGAKKV